ncbi:MAG TPA: hypothetical protein VJZ76_25270 [Thermoanaerobaculia bacterium]|nr:hypothetical protein [Thermoanaerobaculia bacterium]
MTTFSIAQIDELWLRGKLAERRLMHGAAEQNDNEIIATDARDDALVAECEAAIERMHRVVPPDARVRLVSRNGDATMTVEINGVSVVTTPEFADEDVQLLRQPPAPRPLRPAPLVWHHGSAAVLLHEAIGHPRELNLPEIEWPSWLRVDCPIELRRASFSDVPLRRMTRVVVSQIDAPFDLPDDRIDVQLVRGGAYDPLTDVVTIDVAVPQFTIRATRAEIAAALLGATGEPVRYPGVVCSREGQELVVGSYAPVVVTRGFA